MESGRSARLVLLLSDCTGTSCPTGAYDEDGASMQGGQSASHPQCHGRDRGRQNGIRRGEPPACRTSRAAESSHRHGTCPTAGPPCPRGTCRQGTPAKQRDSSYRSLLSCSQGKWKRQRNWGNRKNQNGSYAYLLLGCKVKRNQGELPPDQGEASSPFCALSVPHVLLAHSFYSEIVRRTMNFGRNL